jgi:hypothetical protein
VNKLSKQLYVKSQKGGRRKKGGVGGRRVGGSKGSRDFFGRFYPQNTAILVEKLNHKNLLSCLSPASPLSLILYIQAPPMQSLPQATLFIKNFLSIYSKEDFHFKASLKKHG